MLHLLQIPDGNQRGPDAMAAVLRGLHAGNRNQLPIRLIVANDRGRTQFFVECPPALRSLLLVHLVDAYPGARLERIADGLLHGLTSTAAKAVGLRPLLDFDFLRRELPAHDPMTGILSLLSGKHANARAGTMLELRPARQFYIRRAERSAVIASRLCFSERLRDWMVQAASSARLSVRVWARMLSCWLSRPGQSTERPNISKLEDLLFEVNLIVSVAGDSDQEVNLTDKLTDIIGAFALFASPINRLIPTPVKRNGKPRRSGLWSAEELALVWHPPRQEVQVAKLDRTAVVEIEPPQFLTRIQYDSSFTPLGRVAFRRERQLIGLPIESMRRHVYITGKTGVGKSSLMHSMMTANMRSGLGIALFDPHGDLYQNVIAQVPRRRSNDLILFDPSSDRIVPFNPLDCRSGIDRERVADGVLSAFVKIFGLEAATAPRLLHIFRNSLLTLVEQPDATLIGINRLLTDSGYRKSAMAHVSNPAVREFWHVEFGRWNERDRATFLASLQNKLGAFLTSSRLQLILGQPQSGFDLREIMDNGKILLCNLSKGAIGEDAANLLGALLLSSLQIAGESRVSVPIDQRRDFVCYVDELQNYATSAMETALSESRKYRAPLLVLANQYLDQLTPQLRSAIIGNCGTTVTFQVGSEDAPFWAQHFSGKVTPEHLMAMPKYHAIGNLLIDGMPSGPLTFRTLPPPRGRSQTAEKLIRHSRRQFARSREGLRASVAKEYAA